MADELLMARQYARRLHQAREVGLKRLDKRTPGGRFNTRAHMRAQAQRTSGAPMSSHPWEITKVITAPLQEPHVALVIDTSGSMSGYEYALGPITWVLSTGLLEFGGRCAIALFGNGAELLSDGSRSITGDSVKRSSALAPFAWVGRGVGGNWGACAVRVRWVVVEVRSGRMWSGGHIPRNPLATHLTQMARCARRPWTLRRNQGCR